MTAMRLLAAFLLTVFAATGIAEPLSHHKLSVAINPDQHSLSAEDWITMPPGTPRTMYFFLHRDLHPASPDAEITLVGEAPANWLLRYRVTLPATQDSFTLTYGGEIFHPPRQDVREARTFESTPGIIASEGAVLTGDSGWYPRFGDGMLTFSLDIRLPQGWHAISQGKRNAYQEHGNSLKINWDESQPQNEIYLIAAPFTEYMMDSDGNELLVYLRSADKALAQRYLEATGRYITMYKKLIGKYPYDKFALVENFWETGYGMPSFTLLGSQVIRLPFIIDTSYPHEILHNWWGNGVYVDYAQGNWSEGLTAYMADHLLQEQKGNGAEYRRSILQKYTDFVSAGRDFPLTQFTSRHSEQSEAVGYGKAMMMFHMLRRRLGDETFIRALQKFYRDYSFKPASYNDLAQALSQASGEELQPFFEQWVQQAGAPQLRLVSAQAKYRKTSDNANGYELELIVEQIQPGKPYAIDLPIAVTLAGQDAAYTTVIAMKDKQSKLDMRLPARPMRVDVDPEFDIFRRLDRAEIPASFSQIFGAENLLIVLPRKANEALREQYRSIAEAWQKQPSRSTTIKWDDEIAHLPDTDAVWLFGWENAFRKEFKGSLEKNATMSDNGIKIGDGEYESGKHALALTSQLGKIPAAWLAAPDAAMAPVLARKLPHYSKYSYAAFSGAEMSNLAKGMWPVTNSPLSVAVKQEDGSKMDVVRGKLAVRKSLADK